MSNNGSYQIVDGAPDEWSNSTNFGEDWSVYVNTLNEPFSSISIDNTGQNQALAVVYGFGPLLNNDIYYSSDSGNNWTEAQDPFSPNDYELCISIHISPDNSHITTGTYINPSSAGTISASIYTTTNYNTWTLSVINNNSGYVPRIFEKFRSSYDGKYMLVLSKSEGQTIIDGYVYLSNDYGSTWNYINMPSDLSFSRWTSISVSNSGQIMSAITSKNSSYYCLQSQDYGVTWNIFITTSVPLYCIAIN
jgi:photosystem II stability/assembly factor-like uncharacterized protein